MNHPEKIGRYEIERELGRGGMAVVYLARDPFMQRQVAVKVMPRLSSIVDTQFRIRFEREAKVVATLEHPAIVPVYDFGYEENMPFLVMRYMPGGALKDRLEKAPFTAQETIRVFQQLTPALDYAHQQKIIHRDLKPGNILFDQANNPCIADFGVAKISDANTNLTGSGMLGTPAYMSPEQALGKEDIDSRTDVYAMGVVLFEILTGKLPFEANTPMSLLMAHIMTPVPDILSLRPDLPAPYKALIHKAMAKEKEARFQTLMELTEALIQAEKYIQAAAEPTLAVAPIVLPTRTTSKEREVEDLEAEESDDDFEAVLPPTRVADHPTTPPQKIGRYIVKSEISRTLMSVIYEAFDPSTHRNVAIKVLPSHLEDKRYIERFFREARTLARMENDAIVPIFDLNEEKAYFVMGFMPGGSLRQRLTEKGAFPAQKILPIMQRMAKALDFAHDNGVIHRDLKPENIVFDLDEKAYLTDFGLARLSAASVSLTQQRIVGTFGYMSPEQFDPRKRVTRRSDVYALGVILFELLTGKRPYQGEIDAEYMNMHLNSPIPKLSDHDSSLTAFQPLIDQAMSKDPNDRFGTAGELARAFETILTQGAYKPRPAWRKYARYALLPIGLILLVLAGAAITRAINQPSQGELTPVQTVAQVVESTDIPTSEPTQATTPILEAFVTKEPTPVLTEEPIATEEVILPSPTPGDPVIGGAGKIALFVKSTSGNDIWVANLDGNEAIQLTNKGGAKTLLQWIPDGSGVTYFIGQCLYKVEIALPYVETLIVCFAEPVAAFEPHFKTNQLIISIDTQFYLFDYDLEALRGRNSLLELSQLAKCPYDKNPPKAVRWSADGRRIAVVVQISTSTVQKDAIRILDIGNCEFKILKEVIGETIIGELNITDFYWDGDSILILHDTMTQGFGQLHIYNYGREIIRHQFQPAASLCCYIDVFPSPDGQFVFFAWWSNQRDDTVTRLYFLPIEEFRAFVDSGNVTTFTLQELLPEFTNLSDAHTQAVLLPAP